MIRQVMNRAIRKKNKRPLDKMHSWLILARWNICFPPCDHIVRLKKFNPFQFLLFIVLFEENHKKGNSSSNWNKRTYEEHMNRSGRQLGSMWDRELSNLTATESFGYSNISPSKSLLCNNLAKNIDFLYRSAVFFFSAVRWCFFLCSLCSH